MIKRNKPHVMCRRCKHALTYIDDQRLRAKCPVCSYRYFIFPQRGGRVDVYEPLSQAPLDEQGRPITTLTVPRRSRYSK